MSAPEKSALQLRERSVTDLKTHLDQLGELLSTIVLREVDARRRQQAELEKVYREKHSQLESEQVLRMAELAAQRERNEAALEEAKKALGDREAEFELRESKYVRRDLLKKLNDLLDQFKNFKISEKTSSKRLPVFLAVCLMCVVFGGLGGVGGYRYFETLDLHFLVPFTGGVIGLTATLLYYVKWSDRWFREHADAELQSMRYKSDMLRASWIAELVSEWADGKAPPPELLEVFSKNLFQPNAGMTEVEHPAESIVGLLKRVQRLDVAKDHVTIEANPGQKS